MLLSTITQPIYSNPTFWQLRESPIEGVSESIGGYSNGCLVGASPLNFLSEHYQILRTQNNRFYGHPELIGYIEDIASKVHSKSLGKMLVGDMSMPAGGRFDSGHASHQSGLDVDIWLQLPSFPWDTEQLSKPVPLPLVDDKAMAIIKERWRSEIYELIKIAASDKRVARIFVNPAIKKQLCQEARNTGEQNKDWLRYVRPWHYHQYHMHIRLQCPSNDLDCQNQPPIPAGDGCGSELESWFTPKKNPVKEKASDKKNTIPDLPERCELIRQHFNE